MNAMHIVGSVGIAGPRQASPATNTLSAFSNLFTSRRCTQQPYALRQSAHQQPWHRGGSLIARADAAPYGSVWTVPKESYLVLGVAHCFEKDDNNKLKDVMVIEPVSANALEGMVAGTKTCFTIVTGVTAGDALKRNRTLLPAEFADAAFCEDYEFRCEASARTWSRPHAQDNLLDIVPLGSTRSKFNYSLDEKRVLNMENVVSDQDNIKQDMSIDVYGRKDDSDNEQEDEPAAASANDDDDDDDLDALLAG